MHIVSLIMPCNCTLIWSPDMCFKWSRDSERNHLTSKALGHHFLSTLSAHTWKSYLYNSPVAKALTREVGAQGSNLEPPYSEETVLPTRLLEHLEWGHTSSWKCTSVQSNTQEVAREQSIWTKRSYRLRSMARTWVGQERVKHECKFKQSTKITKIWFLQIEDLNPDADFIIEHMPSLLKLSRNVTVQTQKK